MVEENTTELVGYLTDGAVIVEHDATMVLAPARGVLHVRLVAPVADRVAYATRTTGLSPEAAPTRQVREDRMRVEMSQRLSNYDQTDPRHYDLVIDTASVGTHAAADQIVAAYRTLGER